MINADMLSAMQQKTSLAALALERDKAKRPKARSVPGSSKAGLSDMDMPSELIEQFRKVKDLQESVIEDDDIPANQRAQVAGAVAATLQQLIKMQTEFYTSERFRSIENLMIAYMKGLPLEQAEEFLTAYEALGAANE